ncbi:hypothetical protein [Streptomyces oceani]|uniref:hypothetical protein n=1 Tax=Streptomyces oceani TaxID=1075402 RepID=UPI001112CDFE|nr:hypothetical protein [Streptomyces oceani]
MGISDQFDDKSSEYESERRADEARQRGRQQEDDSQRGTQEERESRRMEDEGGMSGGDQRSMEEHGGGMGEHSGGTGQREQRGERGGMDEETRERGRTAWEEDEDDEGMAF